MLKTNLPVEILEKFSIENMKKIVQYLSFPRPYGTNANLKAREFIVNEFVQLGYDVQIQGKTGNIVAGDITKAKYLIGSHYDTVPGTPGADDNASAVAVMLEIASQIKREDVCFVSFNAEEIGLLGSTEFVDALPKDHKLIQVHVLEMVGYKTEAADSQRNPLPSFYKIPTVGDFIGVISNNNSLLNEILKTESNVKIVGLAIPKFPSIVETFAPHVTRSDHAPFWKKKIDAVMWTDTAEFRNFNYHGPDDVWQNLDFEFMSGIAQTIVNLIGYDPNDLCAKINYSYKLE